MSKRAEAAVLDIGSSKISVLVGEKGINNTFNIKGSGSCEYSGFTGGEFFEPAKLSEVIQTAIKAAESNVKYKIKELFIGVPGEFSTSVCREAAMSFRGRRKVSELDTEELFKSGNIFKSSNEYAVIGKTPVYYMLDDNNRIMKPEGHSAAKLSGFLCYTLAERKFILLLSKILNDFGISDVKFVSSPLAEMLFLFEPETRDRFVFLIDIGYITTNLIIARGDGMLYLKTIPLGGGHISADLSECLKISFNQGEALKRQVELCLDVNDEDIYKITVKDQTISFKSSLVHQIVADRLEEIGNYINQCVKECPYPFPEYIPVSLTGGGICYMRGAREYLSRFLGKAVETAVPPVPQINKPHLSSVYGLLNYAIEQKKPKKPQGLFSKLFFGE